ncbi:MAG: hypothetical protein LBU36_01340 [Clostridiales bacterium]|jgi:hypothetical protein|nr:hypothetical protein [Clostridiales bacterium]
MPNISTNPKLLQAEELALARDKKRRGAKRPVLISVIMFAAVEPRMRNRGKSHIALSFRFTHKALV